VQVDDCGIVVDGVTERDLVRAILHVGRDCPTEAERAALHEAAELLRRGERVALSIARLPDPRTGVQRTALRSDFVGAVTIDAPGDGPDEVLSGCSCGASHRCTHRWALRLAATLTAPGGIEERAGRDRPARPTRQQRRAAGREATREASRRRAPRQGTGTVDDPTIAVTDLGSLRAVRATLERGDPSAAGRLRAAEELILADPTLVWRALAGGGHEVLVAGHRAVLHGAGRWSCTCPEGQVSTWGCVHAQALLILVALEARGRFGGAS